MLHSVQVVILGNTVMTQVNMVYSVIQLPFSRPQEVLKYPFWCLVEESIQNIAFFLQNQNMLYSLSFHKLCIASNIKYEPSYS